MKRLLWFKNDLRIHDNETLRSAVEASLVDPEGRLACLYIDDGSLTGTEGSSSSRMGPFRRRFLMEALTALKQSLESKGLSFFVAQGRPEVVLPEICRENEIDELYFSTEFAFDERATEAAVEFALEQQGVRAFKFQTSALLDERDYADFRLNGVMSFSKFRKQVEESWSVRPSQPPPPFFPRSFSFNGYEDPSRLVAPSFQGPPALFKGGESRGIERLREFVWDRERIQSYKLTRNGLLDFDDSSKLSPWLNRGCLSAREVYTQIRLYEAERVKNESTYWLLFELLWRDHFQFLGRALGPRLFGRKTPVLSSPEVSNAFRAWCEGRTSQQFIDAAMNELKTTGWMSNRMRQNVASYLVHNQGVDWRLGAQWFEKLLIDYDPCSNWGNWSYIAGVRPGDQPHIFDVDWQASRYDPEGIYVRTWTPK